MIMYTLGLCRNSQFPLLYSLQLLQIGFIQRCVYLFRHHTTQSFLLSDKVLHSCTEWNIRRMIRTFPFRRQTDVPDPLHYTDNQLHMCLRHFKHLALRHPTLTNRNGRNRTYDIRDQLAALPLSYVPKFCGSRNRSLVFPRSQVVCNING